MKKPNLIYSHWHWRWVRAWIDLACALVNVITLTFWIPTWDIRFSVWVAKSDLRRRVER